MDATSFEAALNAAKKNWDSKPTGSQESYEAYKQYQSAVKAYSDWALSTLSNETKAPPSFVSSITSSQPSTDNSVIKDFENKLLEQAKTEAASSSSIPSKSQEIAQVTDTANWPSIKDKQQPPILNPKTGWPTQPNIPPIFRGTPSGRFRMANVKANPFTRTQPALPAFLNPRSGFTASVASRLAQSKQTKSRTPFGRSFFG